jgi:hypothetical protein
VGGPQAGLETGQKKNLVPLPGIETQHTSLGITITITITKGK